MCVRDGTCFRVDTETDMLTEAEVREFDALVREADMREVKSFVDDKVFKLIISFCHTMAHSELPKLNLFIIVQ